MNKIALLLDFDGTVDERNVAILLLERFALDDWRRFISMCSEGLISFRESTEQEFACLPAQREQMTEFALKEARLREGLHEIVEFCERRGFPVAIVSGGLDFYIQAIMARHGLEHIPYYCGTADFGSGDRLRVSYNGRGPVCDLAGTCKCLHVKRYQEQGYRVALVGDGTSDFCVAPQVDYLFATRRLLEYCREKGLPHFPFETFHDVLSVLRDLTKGR